MRQTVGRAQSSPLRRALNNRDLVQAAALAFLVLHCAPKAVVPASAGWQMELNPSIDRLRRQALRLAEDRRFADAARVWARAVQEGDAGWDSAYGAARCFALAGETDLAFAHLELAVKAGFEDLKGAQEEADLQSLHRDARWAKLVESLNAVAERVSAEEAYLNGLSANATLPALSREEMYADFDAFARIVTDTNPQPLIRKAVTGIDPLQELDALRPRIEEIGSAEQFLWLIRNALTVFQDGHTALLRPNSAANVELRRMGVSEQGIALLPKYDQIITSVNNRKSLALPLRYIGGEYYTVAEFRSRGQIFPSGLRLVRANGQDIHRFVGGLYSCLWGLRWDFARRRYFSERICRADCFRDQDVLTLTFEDPKDARGRALTSAFVLSEAVELQSALVPPSAKEKRVELFEPKGILYIRMPTMRDVDYFPEAIRLATQGREVRGVVLDVRGNPGGSDRAWQRALEMVIDEPIRLKWTMAFNSTTRVLKELRASDAPTFSPAFLGGALFRVSEEEYSIRPNAKSIRFPGRIQILQDQDIASSAGALTAVALLADKLVTVGGGTGRFLGRGLPPSVFELPRSRILFSVEPVIDLTDVNTAEQAYHDAVELPVEPKLEDILERIRFSGDVFSQQFLELKDPAFRAAMAISVHQ